MAAPKGNRFWEQRSSHGRNPIFSNPDTLWEACTQYFKWVDDNPLMETKVFSAYDGLRTALIPHMRAMTIAALCLYIDISEDTWSRYRESDNLCGVVRAAEKIIYDQKFTGAAADMLNANIIARDLGLKDKTEQAQVGADGGAVKHEWNLNVMRGKAPILKDEE